MIQVDDIKYHVVHSSHAGMASDMNDKPHVWYPHRPAMHACIYSALSIPITYIIISTDDKCCVTGCSLSHPSPIYASLLSSAPPSHPRRQRVHHSGLLRLRVLLLGRVRALRAAPALLQERPGSGRGGAPGHPLHIRLAARLLLLLLGGGRGEGREGCSLRGCGVDRWHEETSVMIYVCVCVCVMLDIYLFTSKTT
jgi:hypothetical protein